MIGERVICGGGKGRSTSTYTPNAAVGASANQALTMAQNAANQSFQLPAQPVAGFTPDQLTAFQNVRDTQGFAQPYFDTGAGYMTQSAAPVTGAETANYLNPYSKFVMDNLNEQFGQQRRDITGKLTGVAGGVGADRIAVGQSELGRQQGLATGQTMAGIYDRALQAAQADKMRQANAGFGFSMMGPAAQQAQLQGTGALLGTGGQQQQLEQAKLMSPFQQELARIAYPFQTSQFLSGVTSQLAPGMGGTTQTQQPAPSIWSQLLGAGTAAASMYGGLGGGGFSGPFGTVPGSGLFGGYDPWAGIRARGGTVSPYPAYQGYEEGGDVEEEQPILGLMDPTNAPNLGQYPFLAQNMPSIVPQLAAQRAQGPQPTPLPLKPGIPPVGPPQAQGAEYGSSPYPMAPQSEIMAPQEGTRAQQFARSPSLALTAAGLGMMAGTSPYAGVNIGRGGLEGVKVLEQQRTQEGRERQVDLVAKRLLQQAEQHRDKYTKMTPYQSGLLSRENLQYIGNNSENLPVYLDRRTGKERIGSTPISAKASSKGPSATEWKYNAWLSAHPEDANTEDGKQRALEFASGRRQMGDADINKSALSMAQREVSGMWPQPKNPAALIRQRAIEYASQIKGGISTETTGNSSKSEALSRAKKVISEGADQNKVRAWLEKNGIDPNELNEP